MPTCPRCGIAFIDGESHTCSLKEILRTPEEKVFRLLLWLGFALLVLLVIYAVVAVFIYRSLA